MSNVESTPVDPPPQTRKTIRNNRDQQRKDTFRRKKNVDTDRRITAKINQELGLEDLQLDRANLSDHKVVTPVPVTTGGIGFATVYVASRLGVTSRQPNNLNLYGLYRAGLASVEANLKISEDVMKLPPSAYASRHLARVMDQDSFAVASTNKILPTPIAKVVNSLGDFELNGSFYAPYLLKPINSGGSFVPHPHRTTYSNLTDTITYLANPASVAAVRQFFRLHSTLPGAIWSPANVLMNPGDFAVTGVQQLRDDFTSSKTLMTFLSKHAPKLTSEHIKMDGHGSPACLISSDGGTLSCIERTGATTQVDYCIAASRSWTNGSAGDNWCSEILAPTEQVVGCAIMSGVITNHRLMDTDMDLRSPAIAKAEGQLECTGAFNLLY